MAASIFRWRVLLSLVWLGSLSTAMAGPLEDIKAVSSLDGIEPRALLGGKIISSRGGGGTFLRGLYIESVYYVKAPVAKVGDALMHGNPSLQKELEVDAYKAFPWPVPPAAFKDLQLSASRPADRVLLEETLAAARGNPGDLHLSKAEVTATHDALASAVGGPSDEAVNTTWRQLLQARAEAVAKAGLKGQAGYSAHGVTFQADAEFKSLLKMTPDVDRKFNILTNAPWLHKGGPCTADEVVAYGEQSPERSRTIFTLGLLAAKKAPTSWQIMDLNYYTTNTYFMSLTLYQTWEWENGSLIYQVDYVSAPFRSGLMGVDKHFAGSEMLKDTATGISVFRKEVEGN